MLDFCHTLAADGQGPAAPELQRSLGDAAHIVQIDQNRPVAVNEPFRELGCQL